jgi:signal transduction histidine kinase
MTILIGMIGLFMVVYQKRILKEKEKRAQQELEFQSRMIKLQLESLELERKRIGADLHDSLGSLFWGAKVNVSIIQRLSQKDEATKTSFQELNQILDEGVEVVRRIAWELTPEAFHYSGFSVSVARLCERFNGKGIEIRIDECNPKLWNDNRALQAFRVVQELLSNAIKHSKASLFEISLKWSEKEIKINVKDNGIGIQGDMQPKGLGLWNVNQRIRQLNGKIQLGIPPIGNGLEVDMCIPLEYD